MRTEVLPELEAFVLVDLDKETAIGDLMCYLRNKEYKQRLDTRVMISANRSR